MIIADPRVYSQVITFFLFIKNLQIFKNPVSFYRFREFTRLHTHLGHTSRLVHPNCRQGGRLKFMTFALLARFISSLYSSSRSTPKTSISLPDVSQCLLRRSFIAASTASTTSIQSQSIFGRHGLKFSGNAGASVPTSKDLTLWHFIRHNFTFELITA